MRNWRELLQHEFEQTGDSFETIVTTLTDEELDRKFDDGFGSSEGEPFTAWSENYVYFPVVYDGAEWVGFAPRNPNGKATKHVGRQ